MTSSSRNVGNLFSTTHDLFRLSELLSFVKPQEGHSNAVDIAVIGWL